MRRKFLSTMVDAVLICFVASLLLSTIVQRLNGTAWGWIGIQGSSMEPTLANGSLALCLPARVDGLQVGDIVVFRSGGQPPIVCHRIIARDDEGFVTRGDGVVAVDQHYGLPAVNETNLSGYVPQLAGRPIALPLLGKLVGGGESHPGSNLAAALGISFGLLLLSGSQPKRRLPANQARPTRWLTAELAHRSASPTARAKQISATPNKQHEGQSRRETA